MKLKKLFAILLTLCMLLSAMPLTVFAEDCAHEYDYDCSNNCNICGEYIRYEAECVEGEPEVADTYSLQHQLYYNCTYCNELMFSRWESHNDNDSDGACDVCGYELHVHTYNYDCSTSCNGCSEITRPEAGHVDNAVVTDIREDKHSITYYCLYCNKYLREDHYVPHVDDDGDRICDACGGTVAVYTVTYYEYDGEQDYYYDNGTAEVLAGESVTLGAQYSYWYKGIGWATEPYGELVYAVGDTFTPTGDTALYSVVEPFTATVDLGAEDAVYRDADGNPITAIRGEMPYSLATITVFPTRVGYVFAGFVDGDGYEYGLYQDEETGERYVEVSMWQDITITALWELCTAHEYVYDCYTGCKLCGKYSRPEAEHVKGEPEVYEIAVDYHGAKYYCVYCGCLLQTGLVSHEDNDGDDICDVCGYGACAHEYDYECSNNCNICGEYTRPEVGCVKGDPEVYAIEVDSHAADYYCVYCGEICQSGFVPHEDNDGIIGCDVCGYGACTHEYDYDCSTNCNVCGETTRPEAACVKGAPEIYYILTDSHAARYYCIYCGVRIQIGTEPHVDDDGDGICDVCGGYDHPEGDHVEGEPEVSNNSDSHKLIYYCRYCNKYMSEDPYEPHADNDADSACDVCGYAVCAHEYDYDCSTKCNVCGKTTRPEPDADHTYAYDCATDCSLCGKTARPEPDVDHTYAYECSGVCNVCYGYTRPEAKCVKGDPTYWIGSNNHEALYYCIYCNGFLGQGTSEPHSDNDADGACDVCNAGADCAHEYDYGCSKRCNLCDYKLRPDADHVTRVDYDTDSYDHKAHYYCIYCESYQGLDPWEPHVDDDGIIGCDVCGYGGCAHEYDYDCSADCNICGQTTRPEAQHTYDYDCSVRCNVCDALTRYEADHVKGDPTYWTSEDEHLAYYYCIYCNAFLDQGTFEPHADSDADGACDACGAGAGCAHEYDYDCSKYCNVCGYKLRPEAECVEGETEYYTYVEEYHAVYVYCAYCDDYDRAYGESHYDDDTDGVCDACGACLNGHQYAHEYDEQCDVCGTYRDVAFPLTAHGVAVSEDVNGLAMLFSLQADGLQFNGTKIDYTNATMGGYKLITAGAVVSNNYETTGIIPTLDNVDDVHILDVTAVYAYDYDEATSTLYYAIRIKNIPDEHKDTMVVFTPYIILEDEDGNRFTYYPNAWYAIYNENI